MKVSIQLKIVMIYLCTIFIIMLISGTFIIYSTEARDYKNIETKMEQISADLENRIRWNDDAMSGIKDSVSLGDTQVFQLNAMGRVEWGTGSVPGKGEIVQEEVVIRALKTKEPATAKYIPFVSSGMGRVYTDHARPVLDDNGEVLYIIYIKSSISEVYANMGNIIKTITTSSVVGIFIMIAFGVFFSRMITLPIAELTTSAKKLAKGNSITRIPVNANDEIGELTQSFNYMASQLSTTMALISSEKNKLEKIFEHMADGVMAFNRQGMLIHVNTVCYEMVGALNMGHRFESIFENIELDINFEKLLQGEEYKSAERMVVIEDKYLSMHFAVYMGAENEPDGLVVVIQDVTKQQKLDQMRKEFVANVSHELRTPLTTVKSYTETLIDGAIDEKEVAIHFLNVMNKETDRMTALVKDLLELSRIDNKQIQLNMMIFDFEELVSDALEAQAIHIEKSGHQLIYEVDKGKTYYMYGDSMRMKQILHNILSNAIKYSPEPGTLTVLLRKEETRITVSISDTGMGIPAEDLGRIFERFYRVDKARSRALGGTGLGLAIAKEMIELHGGHIQVESQLGKGTTVRISFEAYEPEELEEV